MTCLFNALFLLVISLITTGCASGPQQSLQEYAEMRTRQLTAFNGCAYGAAIEDAQTSAYYRLDRRSDPGWDSYNVRRPEVVEQEGYGATKTQRCAPSPAVAAKQKKLEAERAAAERDRRAAEEQRLRDREAARKEERRRIPR